MPKSKRSGQGRDSTQKKKKKKKESWGSRLKKITDRVREMKRSYWQGVGAFWKLKNKPS